MALVSSENPLGQIPNPVGPGEIIYNHGNSGSTQINFVGNLYPGTYQIKASSGGGASDWDTGYWWHGTRQGGSGGVWEGLLRFDTIVSFRADVDPNSGSTGGAMAIYVNGTRLFHISGGQRGDGVPAYGGVLTQDPALALYVAAAGNQVQIAQNGAEGSYKSENFGSPSIERNRGYSTMQTDMPSGLYWGMGAGTGAGATGGGFFIQRIS